MKLGHRFISGSLLTARCTRMHAHGNVQWTMASLQNELEALVNGNEPVDVLRARTASVLASLPSPGLGVDLNFSLGPVMTNKQVDRTVARFAMVPGSSTDLQCYYCVVDNATAVQGAAPTAQQLAKREYPGAVTFGRASRRHGQFSVNGLLPDTSYVLYTVGVRSPDAVNHRFVRKHTFTTAGPGMGKSLHIVQTVKCVHRVLTPEHAHSPCRWALHRAA